MVLHFTYEEDLHVLYDFTHMWDLKNKTRIHKQNSETDLQIQRTK